MAGAKIPPAVQFVELARRSAQRSRPAPETYPLYCKICRARTEHTCRTQHEWEIYRCTVCASEQGFKVR